jgi:cell division protein FtsB
LSGSSQRAQPADSSATFRSVLGIGALALLVLLALGGLKGYRDLGAARQRERQLGEELQSTQQRIRSLEGRIDDLKSDPGTLEKLAREELMMARPDDVVIVLAPPPSDSADPPAPAESPPTGEAASGEAGPPAGP